MAIEDEYRSYQDVIAATLGILQPHVEVATARLETLARQVELFGPRLVISSGPKIASADSVPAWVELSLNPARPTTVSVGGCQAQVVNPTLERLLTVIDELEALARRNGS